MSESSSDQQDHLRSLLQLKKKYDQPTQEEVPQAYKVGLKTRTWCTQKTNFLLKLKLDKC